MALTGVDTDRLPEEKARGITIELGFAALTLDDGRRAAVIDMPGHERFVRTMIAGAGGVDVMLLVVAANEGVMPQTREHLAIADLVGVRGGVCALSKCDLASDDLIALAVDEVREVLRGTALDGAPVIPVSAKEGTGVAAVRAALTAAAVAPRDASGAPVMPIDRVFARKGFGVVVTGTLVAGTLREGDTVALCEHSTRNTKAGASLGGRPLWLKHADARKRAQTKPALAFAFPIQALAALACRAPTDSLTSSPKAAVSVAAMNARTLRSKVHLAAFRPSMKRL
jgi:selenocysteine-specific elongation factor